MATPNIKIESLRSIDLDSLKSFQIHGIPVRPVSCTINSVGGYYSDRTADVFFEFIEDYQKMYLAAHRCILASDSEKFRQMFYEAPAMGPIVKVCDTSFEIFDLFLQSFYNRIITLRIHQIDKLTGLAFYFNANKCKQICIEYMQLQIGDNNTMILRCLDLALRHKCENIQQLCLTKVLEYGHGLVNSSEFYTLRWQVIETVFTVDFYGRDEFKLFKAFLKEAKSECNRDRFDASNPTDVKKYLKKYVTMIRWDNLTSDNMMEIINSNYVDYADITQAYLGGNGKPKNLKQPPKKLSTDTTIISAIQIKDPMMSFHGMYGDEQTADLKLKFQNCTVSLHRCILAAKGLSLARAIYYGNLNGHPTIGQIKIVADFFKPFYGLPIAINIDTISDAVEFGQMFRIDEYENMDFQPLLIDALSADTVFQIHELATNMNYCKIIEKCYTLFKSSTFIWSAALKTESFYRCNPETIKFAFRCGKIKASMLFETIIEWAKYQCRKQKLNPDTPETVRAMIGDINRWIPVEQIDGEQFLAALKKFGDIFSDDDLQMISQTLENRSS